MKTKLSTIEPNYVSAMEGRVTSGLQAAQSALARAREAGDLNAEVEAQKMIAKLGVEEARVANLKKANEGKAPEKKEQTLEQAIAPKDKHLIQKLKSGLKKTHGLEQIMQ